MIEQWEILTILKLARRELQKHDYIEYFIPIPIEHPTENGFCIKVFSGKGILVGFHIIGTEAAEVLSCVTKMPVHPSLSELTSNLHKF